ncbi:hypothetical protein AMTRI_Chr01g108140 [Amborella trichopoda]
MMPPQFHSKSILDKLLRCLQLLCQKIVRSLALSIVALSLLLTSRERRYFFRKNMRMGVFVLSISEHRFARLEPLVSSWSEVQFLLEITSQVEASVFWRVWMSQALL